MTSVRNRVLLFSGAALAALSASPAFAQAAPAGTTSGTTISNQASVTYTIGGNLTTTPSNTATFLVDKKVDLTVTSLGTTYVAVGSTDQVTTFTVQNNTNSVQDFGLTVGTTALTIPLLGTGDFTPLNVRVFADTNKDGSYTPGTDKPFIDELAPDATIKVFVLANIPTGNIHDGIVSLLATTEAGGGAGVEGIPLVATGILTADDPTKVDIVFADSAGLIAVDDLHDGKKIAFGKYTIDNAAITVAKTSKVISDGYSLTNPKAIPGAEVEYCITLTNAGPGTATGLTVNDAIPTNTTFVAGSIISGTAGLAGGCILLPTGTGTFDGTKISTTFTNLTPLVPLAVLFHVKIN